MMQKPFENRLRVRRSKIVSLKIDGLRIKTILIPEFKIWLEFNHLGIFLKCQVWQRDTCHFVLWNTNLRNFQAFNLPAVALNYWHTVLGKYCHPSMDGTYCDDIVYSFWRNFRYLVTPAYSIHKQLFWQFVPIIGAGLLAIKFNQVIWMNFLFQCKIYISWR